LFVNHELESLLATIVIAISLGIFAQVFAHRFKLPAILPLLLFGMGAGPFGLAVFDPKLLGHGMEVLIHLGVAIILFEGGLHLEPRHLRQVGSSIRNLLIIGTLVTAVGAATLAHYLTGISWATASLFGAIVTVTGPTVIAPLLRHMIAPKKVRTILMSEGLLIDPIGAVLAYLVLQWIGRSGTSLGLKPLFFELLALTATGAVLGYVAGVLAIWVVRHRHLPGELRNLVILTVLWATFLISEHQSPQSGILAAVVMGFTVSAAHIPDLNPLKAFKGQLTMLVISVLFILLSGQLDLQGMMKLGGPGLLVVAGLVLLVRPLAVLLSVPPGKLNWREKVLLGLTAPRGIVAAAVASLSAIQLKETLPDPTEGVVLEGLVYLVIIVTCAWATLMAGILPRLLGFVGDPSRRHAVLVGANTFATALGQRLRAVGWTVVVIDSASQKLAAPRQLGLTTVRGDARDAATYEEANIERDSYVFALTLNDELNLLVAELTRDEFGVEHPVIVLQQPSSEFGSRRRAWVDLLGNRELNLGKWSRWLQESKASLVDVDLEVEGNRSTVRDLLNETPKVLSLICGWDSSGQPLFRLSKDSLAHVPRATLLVADTIADQVPSLENTGDVAPEIAVLESDSTETKNGSTPRTDVPTAPHDA
jgi:NhaP-type Na+/H+ or K+/H+ antiporter